MQMYSAIMITILLVSVDALFVGMSLRLQKDFKLYYLFIIFSIILAFSIAFYFVAGAVVERIDFAPNILVGVAFTLLGIRNLFAKDEEKMVLAIGSIVVLGLVMSIDAVVATVALTLEHGNIFFIPILAGASHLLLLLIGCFIARFIKTSHKVHNLISAFCLFLVALLSFAAIF